MWTSRLWADLDQGPETSDITEIQTALMDKIEKYPGLFLLGLPLALINDGKHATSLITHRTLSHVGCGLYEGPKSQ